jgi:hypothetical protein
MHTSPPSTHARHRIASAVAVAAITLLAVGCTPTPSKPAEPPAAAVASSTPAPSKSYVISDVRLEKLPELQTVNVTGKVTNVGAKAYEAVMLTATLYKKGVKIEVPTALISNDVANNLKPGASQEFSVSVGAPDPSSKADVSEILAADEASATAEILEGMEEAR